MLQRLREEVVKTGRHIEVLRLVEAREPVGIMQLSNETAYPHHKVRYSLRVLEDEQLIAPMANGAVTTDEVPAFLREVEADVEDLRGRLETLRLTAGTGGKGNE
jgi:predicted transcriptional regulator